MNSSDEKMSYAVKTEVSSETNEILSNQVGNTFKIDVSNIKVEQSEDCMEVDVSKPNLKQSVYGKVGNTEVEDIKTVLEECIEEDIKISNKSFDDKKNITRFKRKRRVKPPKDEEEEVEDNKAIVEQFVQEDRNIWDRDTFVELERKKNVKIEDDVEAELPDEPSECDINDNENSRQNETNLKNSMNGLEISETPGEASEDQVESNNLQVNELKCNICDYFAYRKVNLTNHTHKFHMKKKNVSIKDYNCSQCSYTTNQKFRFDRHVNTVHLEIKEHKCNQCDFATNYKYHLKIHVNSVHLRMKNHRCGQCDYGTNRKITNVVNVIMENTKKKP
ncbi:hypothetical protein HHI36_020626 [Cryptolaemus montrouzieri]|uniref:C2H2-type domain-containing protein n=1 Tax=Cryptolaemus montrouzieri TaxID=559131 RepID=A0ABD2NBB4_9CUCU